MPRFMANCFPKRWLLAIMLAGIGTCASAAEFHFRSECRVDGGLVLLADVAEILDSNPEEVKRLSAIDLLPAPPAREKRILRVREIQDLLHLRGVNPNDHRFTGASQVTLLGVVDSPTVAAPKAGFSMPMQQITSRVRAAIQEYLVERTGNKTEWDVKFDLASDQAQSLGAGGAMLQVDGGQSPWTGLQELTISFRSRDGVVRIPLGVQVSLPPTMVVAAQSLPRGAILKASDVRLQFGKPAEGTVRVYCTIDEVVGKEATRALVEGQILDEQSIRRPILVQRSDIVTVYARTAGLRVRTTARAMESGGEGDLVRVETLTDRKPYFARVSGPQEAEVYAHAASTPSEASPNSSEPRVHQSSYHKRQPTAPLPPESVPSTTK
jgi:flagella basal body P-ring formation protein FlgA